MVFTSVIILNWNRKEDAANAIDSVLRRDPAGAEVILWDNGSTDGSREYLSPRYAADPRVRLVWHGRNAGVCESRNHAVRMATAPLIVFMDSDSLLETDGGLDLVRQRFADDPAIGALNFEILDHRGNVCWPYARNQSAWSRREFDITRIDGCGFAIRKDVFEKAGGFPLHFGYGAEEHYLARRCISDGFRVVYFPSVTVTHLHVPGGRTSDQFATMMRNHIWMPLELFRMPWALVSAARMLLSYARDAGSEGRMRDFWLGLKWTFRDFRWSRRKPMSRVGWKQFRSIIEEDRNAR